MTKKILILLSFLAPFIAYYFFKIIFKISNKNFPVIKLGIASLVLVLLTLIFFRFDSSFLPDTKYSPPKMENGKVKSAENN
tara:strand:+ start:327 stop:569 length:243 start_codon:yes stop_codon:yes gene_type:complete